MYFLWSRYDLFRNKATPVFLLYCRYAQEDLHELELALESVREACEKQQRSLLGGNL